ncbi:LIM domain only protein 3 isoform X2 [Acanthopagrus latus]|uniref:LIM domain only protein 3 isoform X2 n=1 Tax=Acanthopagrus latus TaxID=8177 RepID=UPI00187C0176|nr:LIM domain only protein 3 isoform X2 [Acanthopagrus latus]
MQKREKSFGIQMLSVQPDTKPKGCAGCNRKIKDRYLLKALDKYWHEDCLKCACCDCRLGEVGSTLYTKANLILCRRDYLRLFGVTGNCAACSKLIPAFEMVMRAKENVYHLDCFACQLCNQRWPQSLLLIPTTTSPVLNSEFPCRYLLSRSTPMPD